MYLDCGFKSCCGVTKLLPSAPPTHTSANAEEDDADDEEDFETVGGGMRPRPPYLLVSVLLETATGRAAKGKG